MNNKTTYTKKISDYTIKEFYNKFSYNITNIIQMLKNGDSLTDIIFKDNRLLYIGILLVIISILLIPLIL
jgi:hypothetical protein